MEVENADTRGLWQNGAGTPSTEPRGSAADSAYTRRDLAPRHPLNVGAI